MLLEPKTEGSEPDAALAVFSQIVLLIATLTLGHVTSRRGITFIGEAGIALLLGAAVGLLILSPLISTHGTYSQIIGFKREFFALAILPPIMFEAGFRLDVERFFANIDGILCFAFAGTLISTFAMGGLVWGAGVLGVCTPFHFLPALLFGSIVSATDPVTVLAVFQRLGADQDLYSLVFGESVLNDAVAMVLYRSLSTFLTVPVTAAAVAAAAATFVGVFAGSMGVGCGVAVLAAWVVKSRRFRSHHMPLESSLVVLLAFASYMLADGLRLSGIVAALFCGMGMAKYVKPNLAPSSRDRVSALFKLLSTLAEVFVFVYIGASLVNAKLNAPHIPAFLGVSFAALAVSRALNIYPCSLAVNVLRPTGLRIPQSHQFVLWFSGLRGAMAFAIALEAAEAMPDERGELVLASTYCIVLATVLVNGGSCTWLLTRLGLRAAPLGAKSFRSATGDVSSCNDALRGTSDASSLAYGDAEEGGLPGDGGSPLSSPLLLGAGSEDMQPPPHAEQMRQGVRTSGLLRQWTHVHSAGAHLFLDGGSNIDQAHSIVGDIDTASTLAASVTGEQRPSGWQRVLCMGRR
ncbi:hypothetical protein D9Q98_008031 [Chlorella vulgaris]|uniref:Sodium/hydrogen exchanger n=1 Tax=Chlorella vulgaris TaxID=3077 RepID=A0A9D4THY6_CHLVU|nr:hypothetical protein D9Q98_008031 [Chlorella vulgaris]